MNVAAPSGGKLVEACAEAPFVGVFVRHALETCCTVCGG